MDYRDAIDYINSFINFEKIPKYQYATSFRLERMMAILEELGNPHQGLNVIHVAGSKGKGSTCAIAAYILKEAGYEAGLYTSPHLVDFRERIRILKDSNKADEFEGMIDEEELCGLIEGIKPVAEKFRDHEKLGKASFFEILTACAFLYFKEEEADVTVLETGLGGRLDATNAAMPLVCGITNISLEHTDKLGDSLSKISHEKAGIIKDGGVVVSARQESEASEAIRKACIEKNAALYEIGRDITYSIVNSDENGQVFNVKGPGYVYKNLELNLIGGHQIENASIGIGMLKAMGHKKFNISEGHIRDGLKRVTWPGRMQIIHRDPCIILDGAQNPASMSTLISSIKKIFRYKKSICVFGISSDKDIRGVSSILDAFSDIIILTKARDNPRGTDISALRGYFRGSGAELHDTIDVVQAIGRAIKFAEKDDLILITGSLFLIGDALAYFYCKDSNPHCN